MRVQLASGNTLSIASCSEHAGTAALLLAIEAFAAIFSSATERSTRHPVFPERIRPGFAIVQMQPDTRSILVHLRDTSTREYW